MQQRVERDAGCADPGEGGQGGRRRLVRAGRIGAGSAANRNFISNAGFVVTGDGVVVIDAQGSPTLAEEMIAGIRRITSQPIRWPTWN